MRARAIYSSMSWPRSASPTKSLLPTCLLRTSLAISMVSTGRVFTGTTRQVPASPGNKLFDVDRGSSWSSSGGGMGNEEEEDTYCSGTWTMASSATLLYRGRYSGSLVLGGYSCKPCKLRRMLTAWKDVVDSSTVFALLLSVRPSLPPSIFLPLPGKTTVVYGISEHAPHTSYQVPCPSHILPSAMPAALRPDLFRPNPLLPPLLFLLL